MIPPKPVKNKKGTLKSVYWMQDPLYNDVFAQWPVNPKKEWVYNHRQKELLESNPLHPFAQKEYFHISELSGSKNCLVRGRNTRVEDVEYVTRIGVDIDEGVHIQNIKNHESPTGHLKTTIIRTHGPSDGKANYQIFINLKPVHKRNFDRLREVHKALTDLWDRGDFEVDRCFAGDFTRSDRYNPHGADRKNYKYTEHNDVVMVQHGPQYELCEVVNWLESLGYTFTQYQSFAKSFRAFRRFFTATRQYEGKQKALFEKLGIPDRTGWMILSCMKKDSDIEIKMKGNNSPGNPRRSLIISNLYRSKSKFPESQQHMKDLNNAPRPAGVCYDENDENNVDYSISEFYKQKTVPEGKRNSFTYALVREKNCERGGKLTPEAAITYIKTHFTYAKPSNFSDNELLKCVKSALKAQYLSPLSRDTLIRWGLLPPETAGDHSQPEEKSGTAIPNDDQIPDSPPAIQPNNDPIPVIRNANYRKFHDAVNFLPAATDMNTNREGRGPPH